jgi:hypothetical protein
MATIQKLMQYLEQGYTAIDNYRIGPAYLTPQKQDDGSLVFEWKAYNMEGDWSGSKIHTQEEVCTWGSDDWGIDCDDEGVEDPDQIEQAIANGSANRAEGFE